MPVNSEEETITRSDKYDFPRNRRAHRNSASGIKLPKNFRMLRACFIDPELGKCDRYAGNNVPDCNNLHSPYHFMQGLLSNLQFLFLFIHF
jgi:hypothetical protein